MRLFVALEVPARVRADLGAALEAVRAARPQLRWTRPEGWHLTLAFLGEVDDDRVGEVVDTVRAVTASHAPTRLSLAAPGRFGGRVLWVGIDDDPPGAVAVLGAAVQDALAGAGLPVDEREVHPHLTLARAAKASVRGRDVVAVEVPAGRWEVHEVGVWRSRLGGGRPARYEEVASARLGAA